MASIIGSSATWPAAYSTGANAVAASAAQELDNVLLSGHVAGLDHESQFDTLTMAADTIIQLHKGRWPAERIRNLVGVNDWRW